MAILIDEKKRVLVQESLNAKGGRARGLMREYRNEWSDQRTLLNFLVTNSRFNRVFRTSFEEIR
jgi:hypothetical protein